jgi:sec-independent protein translocase protein TatA
MFSGADAPWHWLIIAILVIALFGYKKLPDAARSLGRSMRIFKTEIKGMSEDDAARAAAKAEIVPPAQPSAPVVQPSAPAAQPSAPPADVVTPPAPQAVQTPASAAQPQAAESEPNPTS